MTNLPFRAQIMLQEARMGTIEYGRSNDCKRGKRHQNGRCRSIFNKDQ
jgi:hypothetical protein